MISLLIIDSNRGSLELFAEALERPGLSILKAFNAEEGFEFFCRRRPQIVLADLANARTSGVDLVEKIIEIDPGTHVIVMDSPSSPEAVVAAMKKGASDYLDKPVRLEALRASVGNLVEDAQKRRLSIELENDLQAGSQFEGIIGRSPRMWEMFSRIRRGAPHYRALLVTGETGTGKDLVARAVHRLSPVGSHRLVVLNCSAVVETLFESELFGHVKGSFTGATQDKPGLFEYAHGGTLFLDEIGDMPLATQAKLLRALQGQEVQRVGALRAQRVDVRIIAATNQDLRLAIAQKRFREDLYYRLSMVEIHVPRLAERREDLPLLEDHFVAQFSGQFKKEIRGLSRRAQIRLTEHSWPGNVRELENVIGHAAMMTRGNMIDIPDLHAFLQPSPAPIKDSVTPILVSDTNSFAAQERSLVIRALQQADGNQTEAARILRISRDRLRYKLKKYNLANGNSARMSASAG